MFGFNIVVALFSRSSLSVTLCKEGGWGGGGGLITRGAYNRKCFLCYLMGLYPEGRGGGWWLITGILRDLLTAWISS